MERRKLKSHSKGLIAYCNFTINQTMYFHIINPALLPPFLFFFSTIGFSRVPLIYFTANYKGETQPPCFALRVLWASSCVLLNNVCVHVSLRLGCIRTYVFCRHQQMKWDSLRDLFNVTPHAFKCHSGPRLLTQ